MLVAWNWEGRFILTASAGQHNWREENPNEQTRNITTIVIHPSYNNRDGSVVSPFDISVIQVNEDFVLGEFIGTIDLPPANFIHTGNIQAFGWGSMVPQPPPVLPDVLQTTSQNILSFDICREIFNTLFPGGHPFHFNDMCTGPLDGSTGTCNADSGGPSVQNNTVTGRLELVGITAWGPSPCNRPNYPSVLARVSAFIGFINEYVTDNYHYYNKLN